MRKLTWNKHSFYEAHKTNHRDYISVYISKECARVWCNMTSGTMHPIREGHVSTRGLLHSPFSIKRMRKQSFEPYFENVFSPYSHTRYTLYFYHVCTGHLDLGRHGIFHFSFYGRINSTAAVETAVLEWYPNGIVIPQIVITQIVILKQYIFVTNI